MRKIKRKRGFTLIEILIVTAMISILAAAILVSVSDQRKKAQLSKVLAEVSGTIQPMMMCWSDGGDVETLSGGEDICKLGSGYGTWPNISEMGWTYGGTISDSNDWYIEIKDGENTLICCNSASMKCAEADSCNANMQL